MSVDDGGWTTTGAVACARAGNCVIGGFYAGGSGSVSTGQQTFVSTGRSNGTGWTTLTPPTASDDSHQEEVYPSASCVSDQVCTIAGYYQPSGQPLAGAFLSSSGGLASPSDWSAAGDQPDEIADVACADATTCGAFGMDDTIFAGGGMSWTSEPTPVVDPSSQVQALLTCWRDSRCVGAGVSFISGGREPLIWSLR